jgi:cell division transport system permease protein
VAVKDKNAAKTASEKIKQTLEEMEGVEDVQYSEEWLQRFQGLMNVIRVIGFIIGGLLCIGILFIVTNTIKLTIYSRKEEIEIFKLVGATDWFVKTPFLIEGFFQGILSSAAALGILFLGYSLLSAKKLQSFGLAMLQFHFIPPEYGLTMLLIGVVLALAGSLMAVGQFFDV